MLSSRSRWVVPGLAVASMLLRLPYLYAAEGSDEGGYLAVARQWHGSGPSLYTHYWVDRPPLLISLFQLAGALGGLTALRVIGAVAAAIAVLGAAAAARSIAGPRAGLVTAAVSAVLFASPSMGTVQVNGELLAAPFVAWGIALGVRAIQAAERGGSTGAAYGAGALAVAALLVKQNMAEPAIFCTVAALVALRGSLSVKAVGRLAAAGLAGGLAMLLAVALWTLAHGTSLAGVFDAMYPFRIRAGQVLATFHDAGQDRRSHALLMAWLGSGTALLAGVFAWSLLRGQLRGTVGAAGAAEPGSRLPGALGGGLLAAMAYAAASIMVGGGFWNHYLVESIVLVAIAAGWLVAVAARAPAPRRVLVGLVTGAVVVLSLNGWASALGDDASSRGTGIGQAIAAAAQPGDTLVSAFGDAELVETSGLSSPYPYLWTLPAQTDDPKLRLLLRLLAGDDRPTWFVSWDRSSFPPAMLARLAAAVDRGYRPVATVCGQVVYLRFGVVRATPPSAVPCRALSPRDRLFGGSPDDPVAVPPMPTNHNGGARSEPHPLPRRHSESEGAP